MRQAEAVVAGGGEGPADDKAERAGGESSQQQGLLLCRKSLVLDLTAIIYKNSNGFIVDWNEFQKADPGPVVSKSVCLSGSSGIPQAAAFSTKSPLSSINREVSRFIPLQVYQACNIHSSSEK